MAKINVLEKQVAELIAAGEVVERPASIVKELVENAVDAGAAAVTVEIQAGGVRYIRVADNGSGIEREDVANAFLRHATSKVKVSEDLANITTMGFRGEALASIAAMCRVELLTRTKDEVAGTLYAISGGEQERLEDAGCPVGATITVKDVFFNTPARMKFLKKDVSEGNSVAAVVEKAALAHPEVSFKFIRDGAMRMQTPGDGKLLSAVRCVLGREFAQSTIPVHYESGGLALDGCISKPSFARGSRTLQNFFINTRFVRSKTCMAALEEAYRNALMVGKFPSCVLNISVPPHAVDVNVHPAKIEVRFANEKGIFDLVYYGCKTALGKSQLAPEIKAEPVQYNPFAARTDKAAPAQQRFSAAEYRELAAAGRKPEPEPTRVIHTAPPRPVGPAAPEPPSDSVSSPSVFDLDEGALERIRRVSVPVEQPLPVAGEETLEWRAPAEPARAPVSLDVEYEEDAPERKPDLYENAVLVGELFGTYILLQNENEMILVDKHAAHERLLFNRLVAQGVGGERQLLMSPVSVQLSQEEHTVVLENAALLSQAGILVEDFGDGFVVVREVAPILAQADLAAIVLEFAGKLLHQNSRLMPEHLENLYHTIACRAAVKAHDRTEAPALKELIGLLREDGNADHCPHGRPVAVRMSRYEIEKKFGRLG